jgi:hypothetical protein
MRPVSSGAHAGERLVQQQGARLGRQAHRDLELALGAVAERPRRASGFAVEAGRLEGARRRGDAGASFDALLPHRATAAARATAPQAAVLEGAELRKDGRALVAAAEAGAGTARLRPVRDVVAGEAHLAGARRHLARRAC